MKRFFFLSAAAFIALSVYASATVEPRPPEVREVVRAHPHQETVDKLPAPPAATKPAKDFGRLRDREIPDIFYLPKPGVSDEAQ